MVKLLRLQGVLLLQLALVACASTGELGSYRSSALSNFNPAPKSMSPPDVSAADATVDPTYVRTQADYHFTIGEALSLDGETDRAIEEFKLAMVYENGSAQIHLRLANEYLKKGLLTESVEQAEQALTIEPNNVDVCVFLGGVYTALKMYPQAQEKYDRALKVEPDNTDVLLYLGALSVEQEKYQEAEGYFLRAAHKQDNERKHLAYYYNGKMYAGRGSAYFPEAEKYFSQSLKEEPSFEDGVMALADLYTQGKTRKKAYKLLESYQEQFGPKKNVAYQLSQMYLEDSNYERAIRHLRTLESFEPNNLNVKVKIALILIEQKSYDSAIEKLEDIVRVAPESDKIRFYLAAVYEEKGKNDLAIDNYKRIGASSTFYPEAVVHAAYLYRKGKNLSSASALLKAALGERPDVSQFYAFYASILDEQREYKKGIEMLEVGIKKFPENTQLEFYLGSMYDRVGRREDSIREMRKVISQDPNHIQALNYLAYTFAEMGRDLGEADKMAHKAMSLQPNDPFILDTVGWVLFKMGKIEDSIQYLEAAHRLKPDESIIAEHLGDAYYVYELSDKAKEMYLQAVKVEIDPTKISQLQEKILSLGSRPSKRRAPASVIGF